MDKLQYQLKQICDRNRDGSYATQANRARALSQFAAQLKDLGYRKMCPQSLKPKHVDALIAHWKNETISDATIKNRMAHLRWWAEKVNKASVVARNNAHYGIADRKFVTNENKGLKLDLDKLQNIKDPHIRLSLELQREFGLRREEALKFNPTWADQGSHIRLKESWTKGGRAREIPIRTQSQRAVLASAKTLAGRGSMIPPDRKYIQQLRIYEKQTAVAGLSKLHGLRHEYAQRRYAELTKEKAPAVGGPTAKELTEEQKAVDRNARLKISEELGHSREQVTAIYLGR